MPGRRLFLDTFFVQALLNPRDAAHECAKTLLPQVEGAQEVVVTEAVLTEIGNALSGTLRQFAVAFIRRCYAEPNITVVSVDTQLLMKALDLYAGRSDKDWGLTDCISFVVMQDHELLDAATGDRHFHQAGFRALMLDSEP